MYGDHAAILIAGAASLNNRNIGELVEQARTELNPSPEIDIQKKMEDLKQFFEFHVKEALSKGERVRYTVLIVVFYSPYAHKSSIYKLVVNDTTPSDLEKEGFQTVSVVELAQRG